MTSVELHDVTVSVGLRRILDALCLDVPSGCFLVVLGPSGCGKTTLLRTIAGLVRPERGSVRLDGRDVDRVPPRDRDVAMVFQDNALYPHLTVAQSLEFGLRRKLDATALRERVGRACELARIESFRDRYPDRLSGGELRRAAIAKAVVRESSVRLLDEPLSALDPALRQSIQSDLMRWHATVPGTTIHVTHDGQEAMRMADRIAVMDQGRILQCDTPRQLYRRPNGVAVADAIGWPKINLFPLRRQGGELTWKDAELRFPGPDEGSPLAGALAGGDLVVGVRPDRFRTLSSTPGEASAPAYAMVVNASVTQTRLIDDRTEWELRSGRQTFTALMRDGEVTAGQQVRLGVLADDLHVFDAGTQRRIDPVAAT